MFSFHGTVHVRKLYLSLEIGVNRRVSNSGISKVLHWIPQLNRKTLLLDYHFMINEYIFRFDINILHYRDIEILPLDR